MQVAENTRATVIRLSCREETSRGEFKARTKSGCHVVRKRLRRSTKSSRIRVCPVPLRGDCRAIAPTGSPRELHADRGRPGGQVEAMSPCTSPVAQAMETDCLPYFFSFIEIGGIRVSPRGMPNEQAKRELPIIEGRP